jgi:hypothetical protein
VFVVGGDVAVTLIKHSRVGPDALRETRGWCSHEKQFNGSLPLFICLLIIALFNGCSYTGCPKPSKHKITSLHIAQLILFSLDKRWSDQRIAYFAISAK